MAKWLITFENGYCGCNIEETYEGDYNNAVKFADEYLPKYAEYFGWEEKYTEEEYDDYSLNCYYSIKPYKDDDE